MNPIIPPTASEIAEARRAIRLEVGRRYEERRKRARFWVRVVIWFQIEREVDAEMKRRFPPYVLRVAASPMGSIDRKSG